MNVDTIILIVFGAFFLMGFIRGFIREVGALIGFFLALWIAGNYYSLLLPSIKPSLSAWPLIAGPASVLIAYFGLFLISQFVIGILVRLLDFAVRRLSPVPFLKTTNRLAGGALGLAEGALMLGAVLYVFTAVPFSKDLTKRIDESKLAPVVLTVSKILTPFLPKMDQFAPSFWPTKMPTSSEKGSAKTGDEYANT
ncbi:MAG: CvpA family protein, partial [Patescibacteria group bacterium]